MNDVADKERKRYTRMAVRYSTPQFLVLFLMTSSHGNHTYNVFVLNSIKVHGHSLN